MANLEGFARNTTAQFLKNREAYCFVVSTKRDCHCATGDELSFSALMDGAAAEFYRYRAFKKVKLF